jgi:hypothetical protein
MGAAAKNKPQNAIETTDDHAAMVVVRKQQRPLDSFMLDYLAMAVENIAFMVIAKRISNA